MAKKSPSIFSTLQKTTENASAANGELTRQLPTDALVDNPLNRFSMAEDEEFLSTMRSVEQDGFLEDIVVTPHTDNTWRIISGHRRVMAARRLGKATVPCKVRRYPDKLSELRALMGANVHRRSITPFDMARQLETLRDTLAEEGQLPENVKEQSELMAAQSDLSRATVERYLDLLNLDETMTAWAERGDMTMTDAYEMARQKNVHLQLVVEEYVAKNDAKGDFPGLVHRAIAWAKAAELPPPPPKAAPAANPLRTVDSFGRAVRRSTAQLKALDFSADVDKTTARKKLDTCLQNLEELRRTVEALKAGLEE
ncbi:ParB/RepB/Spo0J family partition protein [Oscillibacter sp.]|uniref:ParB/RepB/Spo0J family partition protein n=1 Tax=Oscillibacter sp. TaxID=1945593 RepID=UPI001B51A57F|nr:ParB/RepB/Spo0J family partition protein [Oscillibacter sp.]MBP3510056.1 ParB N-terminal domain-containing protein [Oscillibacter sp.]